MTKYNLKQLLRDKEVLKNIDEERLMDYERNYPYSNVFSVLINRYHYLNEGNLSLLKITNLINKTDNPGLAFTSIIGVIEENRATKKKSKKPKGKSKANKKEEKSKKSQETLDNKNNLYSGIVSEELAKIYVKQGLKKQAIEMYRKLILQNPEKSVYFAKILKKLNKK